MAARNDQTGGSHTEATGIVAIIVISMVLIGIWMLAKPAIIYPAFAINWVLIKIIQLTMGLGQTGQNILAFIEATLKGNQDPWLISFSDFYTFKSLIGERAKYIVAAITGSLAILVMFRMKGDGFKRKLNLVSLAQDNARHWRTALFSARFDPKKPWTEMAPQRKPHDWLLERNIEVVDRKVKDYAKAEQAFIEQLGLPWQGIDNLPLYMQCLVAIIGAHFHLRGSSEAEKLRGDITYVYVTKEGEQRDEALKLLIDPHLKNPKIRELVAEHTANHAWTSTALIHLLFKARDGAGVLATSDFLWLKPIDRSLYYVLNNVGRRKFHIEGAGAISHYWHENIARKPISEPKVGKAVEGISHYMGERGVDELKVPAKKELNARS